MKEIYVGTYELGFSWVKVYLRDGTGADGDCFPKNKGVQTFHIGSDHKRWRGVLVSLLHEAQETAMQELGFAHTKNRHVNQSSADYLFVLNHEQFNECCCRAGELINACQNDLFKAWKKWKSDEKVADKKRKKGKK